ncbi:HAD family hydrolase [Thermodesulfobacteriota bacterium]
MPNIKAIGFDLFNTLIIVEPDTLVQAMKRMIKSLGDNGLSINESSYIKGYRNAASKFVAEARESGIETHNSIWISHVFKKNGLLIPPEDDRIADAIDQYFSAFYEKVHLVPDTVETLTILKKKYTLGLLSNFTHAPAAREILIRTGLAPCFDTILISGELGYRKPHPFVFAELVRKLDTEKENILFTGDDPEPDIIGASKAGLHPVWFTYVKENNVPVIKGTIQSETTEPEMNIPRASSWKEFMDILETQ